VDKLTQFSRNLGLSQQKNKEEEEEEEEDEEKIRR
jgi:hypothetical protein